MGPAVRVAGLLLLAGWARSSRGLRIAGYTWGSLVMTFAVITLAAAAVTHRDPQGHRDGSWAVVLYVASIVGAHVAAATREQSR